MKKEYAVENKYFARDLDDAVEFLTKARESGENIYIDFSGHKLYSADTTLDSAYLEVLGRTYKQDQEWREEFKREREKEIERKKAEATKNEYSAFDIDDAVKFLQVARMKGENIYINFNRHKLYSADATLDSVYLEVLGMNHDDYLKQEQEWREEFQRKKETEKEEALEKIPYWVEEGKKYIPSSLWNKWEKSVEISAKGLYNGKDLDAFLEVVKELDLGNGKTKEDVEEILKGNDFVWAVKDMLKTFSKDYNKLPYEIEK